MLLRLLVLCSTLAGNILFWHYLGRGVELPEVAKGRYDCLSYTPYAPGHNPTDPNDRVPEAIIQSDLKALSAITGCLRLYSTRGSGESVLRAARDHRLSLMLGAWISGDRTQDQAELTELVRLAKAYPDVVKLAVVGNEVLLRRELPYDRLGALIEGVKAQLDIPVAYADVYDFWYQYPQMAGYVDQILVHILPYWGDPAPPSSAAQAELEQILKAFLAAFPGKPIRIGETGWPSAGPARQQAQASIVDQARFVRSFIQGADQLGVPYNLIEAIDQPWKRIHEGTAGGYWGILTADRQTKFPLRGPVSEWPHWPWAALMAGLAGVVLSAGMWRTPRGWRGPLALAFGQVIGSLLVLGWWHASEVSLGWGSTLANYAGVGLIALAGAGFLTLLATTASKRAPLLPAPLSAAFGWLRHPTRLPDPALGLSLLLLAGAYPAAVLGLGLAVNMRHQDIPWMYFLPSALLALTVALRGLGRQVQGRAEAWLGLILLGCAPFCYDGPYNRPAMLWIGLLVLLALPWLGALGRELLGWLPQRDPP